MKKGSVLFVAPIVLFFGLVLAMLILSGSAMAEAPRREAVYNGPEALFTPLNETRPSDYGWTGEGVVSKDGSAYHLFAKPGAEFLFSVPLPKQIPFVQPGGTYIDFVVTPVDDINPIEAFDDWVDIETVEITEDDIIVVVFRIAAPDDIPDGIYEFRSVTDGLTPQMGQINLKVEIDEYLP